MIGFEMLDVAIGIIFIYLLLSLICTAINEIVESKLKLRSVDLEQGIRNLLNDPSGTTLTKKLYDHQLVYSMFRGEYDPSLIHNNDKSKVANIDKRYKKGENLPSYIPSRNFALALMDILLPATTKSFSGATGALAKPLNTLSVVTQNGGQQAPADPAPLAPLREAVNEIKGNERVKTALLSIIDAAGNDTTKAREGIENWYNSAMDRVSGWYKRRVQKIVFVLGFVLAIFMNADSIAIFTNLANDRPLREAIVAAAKNYKNPTSEASTSIDTLVNNVKSLDQLGLPIGWGWASILNHGKDIARNYKAIPKFDPDNFFNSLGVWFLKAFGWFITGMAVSLGAPFWFDILSKIMVIRSTVKPHEKSQEESSQDRQK